MAINPPHGAILSRCQVLRRIIKNPEYLHSLKSKGTGRRKSELRSPLGGYGSVVMSRSLEGRRTCSVSASTIRKRSAPICGATVRCSWAYVSSSPPRCWHSRSWAFPPPTRRRPLIRRLRPIVLTGRPGTRESKAVNGPEGMKNATSMEWGA